MGILNVNLDNINLDDNFDEDDPDTIVVIRLLAWHSKFERHKTVNKREVKNYYQQRGIL